MSPARRNWGEPCASPRRLDGPRARDLDHGCVWLVESRHRDGAVHQPEDGVGARIRAATSVGRQRKRGSERGDAGRRAWGAAVRLDPLSHQPAMDGRVAPTRLMLRFAAARSGSGRLVDASGVAPDCADQLRGPRSGLRTRGRHSVRVAGDLADCAADPPELVNCHLERRLVGLVDGPNWVVHARNGAHLDVAAQHMAHRVISANAINRSMVAPNAGQSST